MRGYYAVIVVVLAVVVDDVVSVDEPECPSSGTVRLPHPKDCTLYYICQDGKSTIHTCPDGLHFNDEIKQCDWPSAGCYPKDESQPETQPNIPDSKEAQSRCIGTCSIPDPKDRTIHLPYGGDCTKFCKCDNGIPFVMDCPDGLHFDEAKSVCNWPRNANCRWRTSKG